MSLSFECENCNRPLEVDDEAAGQFADCPYCRRVVPVPTNAGSIAMSANGPTEQALAPHSDAETAFAAPKPHFGKVALASVVIAQLCFVAMMYFQFIDAEEMVANNDVKIEQIDRGILEPLLFFGVFGGGSAAVFAGIVSLTRKETPRWPALTAMCLTAAFVCGFTLIVVLSMLITGLM